MTLRWSVPDNVFKLDRQFHREALLLIASMKTSDLDPAAQKRLERLMELSDQLTKEWEKSYPVVDGKEFKHLSFEQVLTQPLRN